MSKGGSATDEDWGPVEMLWDPNTFSGGNMINESLLPVVLFWIKYGFANIAEKNRCAIKIRNKFTWWYYTPVPPIPYFVQTYIPTTHIPAGTINNEDRLL
jgi:hypothetical protein